MEPQGMAQQQQQQQQGQQNQGGQRYCPTPMAPPPSSPVPQPVTPMQQSAHHQPPPSISPHVPGYYSHHPHHSFPPHPPQQQPHYYSGYYSHHQGQPAPAPAQHYQPAYYQSHSYYQTQSVVAGPQSVQQQHPQAPVYPPQAQSPYAYAQHQPPQQQQQSHHVLSQQQPSSQQPGSVPLGQQSQVSVQQQIQQPHALMNLSRFVSQQSPCPSPSPHPHSPTTPVPMGSPHYPPQHAQSQGHLSQQPPLHSQSQNLVNQQQQQHHVNPNANANTNLHQGSYNSNPSPAIQSQQNQLTPPLPNANIPAKANTQQHTQNINAIINHPVVNNKISSEPVQISSSDNSSSTTMNINNLSNTMSSVANGGRSRSNSPSPSSCSSTTNKPLSSPPPTPSASSNSNANNGQMIPVRLQNMQKGARTKASMRKLMQEQQNSSSSQIGFTQEGFLSASDIDTESESRSESPSKKSTKSPKKGKKGAGSNESVELNNSRSFHKDATVDSSVSQSNDLNKISDDMSVPAGYTRKGKKIGRPPKPRLPSDKPVKQKGRKIKKSAAGKKSEQSETPTKKASETVSISSVSPTKSDISRHSVSDEETIPLPPEVSFPSKEVIPIEEKSKDEVVPQPSKSPSKKTTATSRKGGRRVVSKSPKKPKLKENTVVVVPPESEPEEHEEETDEVPIPVVPPPPSSLSTRPTRASRASKEQAKNKETKTPERSRQARAKRASVSYKEMSTSRSKSPKEQQVATPSPVKMSPPSPSKRSSPAKTVAAPPSKTSPRLKEASPSPVRIRQLKEQSPIVENRRETRSSKEREDTPKRPSRKAKSKNVESESPDVNNLDATPVSSPSKKRSPKVDTTPIRVSSPRLAKERSTTPKKKSPKRTTSNSQESSETTLKITKISSPKKGKRSNSTTTKEEPAIIVPPPPPAKSRKRKSSSVSVSSTSVTSSQEATVDPILLPPPPEVKPKKAKVQKSSAKQRKGKRSKSTDVTAVNDQSSVTKDQIADVSLSTTSEMESSGMDTSLEKLASPLLGSEQQQDKTGQQQPSLIDTRRRSKSPRQSVDTTTTHHHQSTLNLKANKVLTPVIEHPNKVLDNPPIVDMNTHLPQVNLLDANNSVLPTEALASTVVLPNESSDITIKSNLPSSIVTTPQTTAVKPKKPRKPKIKTPKVEEIKSGESEIMLGGGTKKKTKLEQQLEFQQRKANLEVEVAQVLLEMKHSSKSPSPVKSMDPSSLVATMPVIVAPTLPPNKVTKAKKRKSTSSEITVIAAENQQESSSIKFTAARALSPDVSSPTAALKSGQLKNEGGVPIKRVKKKKQPKLEQQQLEFPVPTSTTNTIPTILAVPQVNGNQSLNFSCTSSISFQNTPAKPTGGPVKVSKTVMIPSGAVAKKLASDLMSDLDSTIASVSSGINSSPGDKTPKAPPRPKKKKTPVVPKPLTPVTISESEMKIKRKYTRKKSTPKQPPQTLPSSSSDNLDNKTELVNASINSNGEIVTTSTSSLPSTEIPPINPSSEVKQSNLTEPSDANQTPATAEGKPPAPKKPRKSSTPKPKKLERFQLHPKEIPKPTVIVKSSPFTAAQNGPSASGTSNDSKEKNRANAPNLKVISGKTKFFRGSDEEELDVEPQLPKPRGPAKFDPQVPWLCCFCSLGPHAQKLGDLFGPYSTEQSTGVGKNKSTVTRETWLHQDCALWAGNVVLIGSKLHGIEETLAHCRRDTCTTCGNKGATIGCLKRGCKQAVHYPCAIRKSWKLDEGTFHSYCPAHIG